MEAEQNAMAASHLSRAHGTEDRIAAKHASYEPTAADDVLGGLLSRLEIHPGSLPEPPRCSELQGQETECSGGSHSFTIGRLSYHVRHCPLVTRAAQRRRIPTEAKALAELLAKCGYRRLNPEDRRDVSGVLLEALEERSEVARIAELLRAVRYYRSHPLDRTLIFDGPRGLGKTHAQLVIHFGQLQLGVRSRYLTSSALASIAKRRQSADPETSAEAEQELRLLQAAEVLVWSDVADRNDHAANMAATTQDMLEHFRGTICASSNCSQEDLTEHPNVGSRATSRLFADHQGREAFCIALDGPDQRTRARRRHLRSVPAPSPSAPHKEN